MAFPRALKPKQEEAVATAYAKGKSSQELADKYGVHRSTVLGAVKRAGIEVRSPGGSKPRKAVKAARK